MSKKECLKDRRFLKHKLICIPTYDRPEGICDFVYQTAKDLADQNVVIILALGENWRGRDGWQKWFQTIQTARRADSKKKYLYTGVFHFIPLQRFSFFRNLNTAVNLTLFQLLVSSNRENFEKILWIFHPQESNLLPYFKNWHVHFDCVDWHSPVDKKDSELLQASRKRLIEAAESITVLTQPVLAHVQAVTEKEVTLVPQGFDALSLAAVESPPQDVLRRVKKMKKPVIGFFGGINQRIDVHMMLEVVQHHTDWSFLFVGPRGRDQSAYLSEREEKDLDVLLRQKNVTWVKKLKRTQLLPLMKKCDVLSIPYDLRWEFNHCCFPMKIMEYFGTKKQIVSTQIPSLLEYKDLIYFGNTPKEFSSVISKAVRRRFNTSEEKKIDSIILHQTWKRKLDAVDVYLNKVLPST